MLSQELEFCLNDAFAGAREARHEFMTVEHLLLAIVDAPKVREILKSCGADTAKLKTELKQFIDQTTPRLPAGEDRDVQPTLGFQRVLQRAVFHVQSSGKKEVTVANVLVAIFSEKQSHAAYLLSMQDVSRLDVVNFIAHGLSKAGGEERSERDDTAASPDAEREGLDGRDITVALDGVGGALGRGALELLAVGGRLILFGFASGAPTELSAGDLYSRGLTVSAAIGPRIAQRPGGVRDLEERALAAAADGRLVPLVQRFALAQAAAAHTAIEARATVGKTVLVP